MANIFVDLDRGIQVAAVDILKFITQSQSVIAKVEPSVVAALGVLLGAVATAITAVSESAGAPLNVALDVQTVDDLKLVWPDVVAFAKTLGIAL